MCGVALVAVSPYGLCLLASVAKIGRLSGPRGDTRQVRVVSWAAEATAGGEGSRLPVCGIHCVQNLTIRMRWHARSAVAVPAFRWGKHSMYTHDGSSSQLNSRGLKTARAHFHHPGGHFPQHTCLSSPSSTSPQFLHSWMRSHGAPDHGRRGHFHCPCLFCMENH